MSSLGGVAYLTWRHLAYRPVRALTLVAAVALTVYLPFALQVFVAESTRILQDRASSSPLLIGPRGSAVDLTLNSLYFTPQALPPLEYEVYRRVSQSGLGTAIPLHVRFRAGEAPIVGTSLAYFRHRGLEVAEGRMLTRLGDCVVGAAVAKREGIGPGDHLMSSPENVFDLAGVYPLKMRVTGVLAPAHSPDDQAVFVDVKTAWIIEGLAHGHEDLSLPEAEGAVLEREAGTIRANASVLEFNEVTDANLGGFHFHGEQGNFPITGVLLVPGSAKERALALGRYQSAKAAEQIVVPLDAVTQLTETLFATRRMTLVALCALGTVALGLAILVFLLSFRLRASEMRTYGKIGAGRRTVLALKWVEAGVVFVCGVGLAGMGLAATKFLASEFLPGLLN